MARTLLTLGRRLRVLDPRTGKLDERPVDVGFERVVCFSHEDFRAYAVGDALVIETGDDDEEVQRVVAP